MPEGPGMIFYEVYGPFYDDFSALYRDWVMYCVRGDVVLSVSGEDILMKEGDAIGYENSLQFGIQPAKPVQPGDQPPLIQFVAANLVAKVKKKG